MKAETNAIANADWPNYVLSLSHLLRSVEITARDGVEVDFANASANMLASALGTVEASGKLIFIGNGGSASIASHMAADYSKNGGLRSIALNDPAMLTCLGNDAGFENVFSRQIEMYAQASDILVAISSSGQSLNILNAVETAKRHGLWVVTLSGFSPDNPLRKLGNLNFYLGSDRYGYVEIGHLTILHAVLDFAMEQK